MTTVAVVTGAGQGIGRAIARRLCGDGFAVALVDLNAGGLAETAEELGRDGAQTLQVQVDLTEIGNIARSSSSFTPRVCGLPKFARST